MNEVQKARCDSFKSIDVGKFGNLKPEEIEKLPDDKPRSMKDLWNKRQFIDFLEVFEGMIPAVASQKSKKKKGREKKKFPHDEINATLPFLPELGYSFDRNVHSAIYACYRKLLELCGARDALQQSLARSVNRRQEVARHLRHVILSCKWNAKIDYKSAGHRTKVNKKSMAIDSN